MTKAPGPIIVINPNASETVTRAIEKIVAPLHIQGDPYFETLRVPEGPATISKMAYPRL